MLEKLRRKYRTLNTVQISAEALRSNFNLFRKMLPNQSVCPVLKSNAYGHGLIPVAKILEQENPAFFVLDSLYEAYELKKARIKIPILILGYTFPENLKKGLPFHFTASDMETAKHLAKLGLPTHLEVDTGMARMGLPMAGLEDALKNLKRLDLNLVGLFTHFADADNADQSYTKNQVEKFKDVIQMVKAAGFQPKWIHCSNSAGATKVDLPEVNMARIGYGIYGISPLTEEDPASPKLSDLQPVMKVVSTIIATRQLKKGDHVSYGCTFEAQHDMRIGVIPFGYYEGLPVSLSNSHPILGRVCMNHTMIDLGNSNLQVGDKYTVYSNKTSDPSSFASRAKQLAKTAPIAYELPTKIAESIRREVV